MPIWPFKKRSPKSLAPLELRDKLLRTAATDSLIALRSLCNQYKAQIAKNVDLLCKIPEGMPTDDGSIDRFSQNLLIVAQCLANECGAPQLWNRLTGTAGDSPLFQWNHWLSEVPHRMQHLDYDALISEARELIDQTNAFGGGPVRKYEIALLGSLGELLFHSGRSRDALEPFQTALDLSIATDDIQGQVTHFFNLLETHCYLDDGQATPITEQFLEWLRASKLPTHEMEKRLAFLKKGEPLCRVVCVRDGQMWELDEVTEMNEGKYIFEFRRNRLSLQKVITLTAQGNELASVGNLVDALEKYREASETDPFDPDPRYHSGVCLLEQEKYEAARVAYDEVERLAPGWFRCRFDRWLADGLVRGTISKEEYLLVRMLDDGNLFPPEAVHLARQGIERFPDFAPLRLFLGDTCGDGEEAIGAYRTGLELPHEPDLESRLICGLVRCLPVDSPERQELIHRAAGLKGSLVAAASTELMGLIR